MPCKAMAHSTKSALEVPVLKCVICDVRVYSSEPNQVRRKAFSIVLRFGNGEGNRYDSPRFTTHVGLYLAKFEWK